jgi:hypothetical protein
MRNAADTTGAVRSTREGMVNAVTIDATTINAVTPTGDWDATDVIDETTSLSAEIAMAEAKCGATAGKKPWSTSATKKEGNNRCDNRDRRKTRD